MDDDDLTPEQLQHVFAFVARIARDRFPSTRALDPAWRVSWRDAGKAFGISHTQAQYVAQGKVKGVGLKTLLGVAAFADVFVEDVIGEDTAERVAARFLGDDVTRAAREEARRRLGTGRHSPQVWVATMLEAQGDRLKAWTTEDESGLRPKKGKK